MEPENLISWFHTLAEDLRQSGTPAEITSGLACIHYNLAETTKDCDIWIPPASLGVFKEIVAQRTWRSTHAVHRSRLSAPLDPRWLDGGWSSHIIWPGPPQAQMDIFGRLPRVTHRLGQNHAGKLLRARQGPDSTSEMSPVMRAASGFSAATPEIEARASLPLRNSK
jgi:hypothetical protein